MRVSLAWTCVFLLLSIALDCTGGQNENNVLVEFSQNVPSENGMQIIENIKDSLQEASKILYDATGILLAKVTIDVPEFWDTSEWNITTKDVYLHSFSSDPKADILIDDKNDTVFGKFPFAQQYGGCGIPGHHIIVPTAFLLDENKFPKGLSLAREWLKYRYGVFDENGYIDDDLYPLYYHTPGTSEVHFTDCTNSDITYDFSNQEGNECPSDEMLFEKLNKNECKFKVNDDSLNNLTSSFMYFQESITNMTHICGDNENHKHNSRSPNKQNLLCYGKSIWDTISNTTAFKNENKYDDPEFVILKRMKSRVVVTWENTQKMKDREKEILNAITKLMIDLPDGSMFSAFPFTDVPQNKDFNLKSLDGAETDYSLRKAIASAIKSDFQVPGDGNYKAAIDKARTILKGDNDVLGNIIVITGTAEDIIVILLKADSSCNAYNDFPDAIDKLTSSSPCLEVVRINKSDEAPESFNKKLIETVERICSFKQHDKVTETSEIQYVPILSSNTSLKIEVDDFTEKVTFSIHTDKTENFELKLNDVTQELKKEDEKKYGNILQLSYTPTKIGTLELSHRFADEHMLIEVQKTSKEGQYFTGEVIVQDTTPVGDTVQMPVIIYAIVRFGSYPVQNATVSAIIARPNFANDSEAENIELTLNDDGRGDPDITQNDGVYSRYFTGFTDKGDYTVTVTVSNDEFATHGVDKDAGYKSCCGSSVKKGDAFKMKQFRKTFQKTFTAVSGRPESGYKPSRITDLKIDVTSDEEIVLTFTAPGGEADSGTVQSYEIKSFTSPDEAKDNFDGGEDIFTSTNPPKERGETEELKIGYEAFKSNAIYYIAMKAKNSNETSDLSPIVEVNIHNAKATDTPDKEKETGDENVARGKTNPKTIGLIVGLIVGLILVCIIIYVVIYIVIVKPKRKKQKENPIYGSSPKTEGTSLSPINFVSADTLIKHHNEKLKAKNEHKDPPIFKEEDFEDRNIPPTNESSSSSNDQNQENSNKNMKNGPPLPAKSPKRITRV